jgi:hypothetical protein
MTPEQREARIRRLVNAAKRLVTGEIGLALGAEQISTRLFHLGAEFEGAYPVFAAFDNAVPRGVPIGRGRLRWSTKLLLARDADLASIEAQFRFDLLLSCIEIIEKYDD